jgi:hypothetical protein
VKYELTVHQADGSCDISMETAFPAEIIRRLAADVIDIVILAAAVMASQFGSPL